jgi:hypothetical protein
LRHAPRWACSDAAVVFDAASGDYWIVTPAAEAVLRRLEAAEALPIEALVPADLPRPLASTAYLREVLDGLVECGLLAA